MKLNEDVARVVWNWRESDSSEETMRCMRKKSSLIKFCIMFLIGSVLFFPLHHVWIGGILYVLSFLILVGGFAVPQIYSAFERVGRFLTITIGSLFTWVLMISFFYVCFVPGRILLCLFRKDPLQRARTPDAQSYWISKQHSSEKTQYQKLY